MKNGLGILVILINQEALFVYHLNLDDRQYVKNYKKFCRKCGQVWQSPFGWVFIDQNERWLSIFALTIFVAPEPFIFQLEEKKISFSISMKSCFKGRF